MKKTFLIIVLFLQTLIYSAEIDPSVTDPTLVLMQSSNRFNLSLIEKLTFVDGNIIYSPLSIFAALSMVSSGAKGETLYQITQTLGLPDSGFNLEEAFSQFMKKSDDRLNIANGIWADEDTYFLPQFLSNLNDNYHAQASSVNFSDSAKALSLINEWVDNQTRGKIPTLLSSSDISDETRLVLTNALFFQGNWETEFLKKKSHLAPFYLNGSSIGNVTMMEKEARLPFFETGTYQVLSMPFKREKDEKKLAFVIFLPKENDGPIPDEDMIELCLSELKPSHVHAIIPKFSLKQKTKLNEALKSLGMPIAFTDKANFSAANGMRNLFLSSVVHEAYIEIDEKGLIAAAATGASMSVTSVYQPDGSQILFKADHPFYFALVDLSDHGIYFFGKLSKP